MSTNYEIFIEYLDVESGLSKKTIDNHKRNLIKLRDLELLNENQEIILNKIENLKNLTLSQKLQYYSTISKFLKLFNKPNDKILEKMKMVNNQLNKSYKERNKEKKYPYNMKQINKQINQFYTDKKYKNYIISYLTKTYNTRNKDLDIAITDNIKNIDNKLDKNWLILKKNSALYLRNIYKTSTTYGKKQHIIRNKKFVSSLSSYYNNNLDNDKSSVYMFSNWKNSTRDIKKLLPFNLSTADLLKINLLENNTLNAATKIGKKRGTAVSTLQNNYNLNV